MKFKDQVTLITGATRGIGKEIALAFAKEGATVIICGTNPDLVAKVGQEFHAQGLSAESFVCDIADSAKVEEMVNKILDKFNRIDILVNNAGITRDNLLIRMKESDWDAVMNINLKGTFNCTKVVSKAMLKAKRGAIINIASVVGITGNIGQANYAASKAGIIGFTKSVARELASRRIRVNAIAPGYIQTEMTTQLSEKAREQILNNIPIGKLGRASDVAGACLFLASEDSRYMTGQTLVVDGGMAI